MRSQVLLFLLVLVCAATPAVAGSDPLRDAYPEEEQAVKQAVHNVWETIQAGHLDQLGKLHLNSSKFTKWENGTVLGYEETVAGEVAHFSALTGSDYEVHDLRAAVFGVVAISTFTISYKVQFGDVFQEGTLMATMAFAKEDGVWRIVHEHFSPVTPAE